MPSSCSATKESLVSVLVVVVPLSMALFVVALELRYMAVSHERLINLPSERLVSRVVVTSARPTRSRSCHLLGKEGEAGGPSTARAEGYLGANLETSRSIS